MDFDIHPHATMAYEHNHIRLSLSLCEELGVVVGQRLQLRGREELVLQVRGPCTLSQRKDVAYVSPESFEQLKGAKVEFQVLEVTLGCDPEFYLIHRDRVISAATYLPFAGQVGCDGTLGELRPRHGKHERQVVAQLRNLVPQIPWRMRRSQWAKGLPKDGRQFRIEAHSYYGEMAAGFHVHLGIPPEILNTRKDFSRAAMNHLVKCLDWYASVPMVPLETSHQRRVGRGHYGQPGDYRPSNLTLEYRVPGAFYLRSPALAEGLLGLCLLITKNVVSRLKAASQGFVKLHKLTEDDLQEVMPIPAPERIQGTLLAPSIKPAQQYLGGIQKQLSETSAYSEHREGVEEFFRIVEREERPKADLLYNWKEQT